MRNVFAPAAPAISAAIAVAANPDVRRDAKVIVFSMLDIQVARFCGSVLKIVSNFC
ncbi:hypothetical protein [Roseovarius halotolerans]|uniref:hypothetical protein n=1 Tax=Roseovarius halotolerans TaxID=505353 RepID=UPI001FE351F8|nr:hypothetical protein [Roseovarius halotolerans]